MIAQILETIGVPPEDSVMFFALLGLIIFVLAVAYSASRRN